MSGAEPPTGGARLCRECSAPVTGNGNQVYCSVPCRAKEKYRRRVARSGVPTPNYKGERACEWCGESFQWHPKMRVRFCSNKCSQLGRCWPGRSTPIPWAQCPDCSTWYIARRRATCPRRCAARERARIKHRASYVSKAKTNPVVKHQCASCGVGFETRTHSSRRLFCSQVCADREAKRAGKARRRVRGASVQRVYRRRIFERDRWRCKLCRKLVKRDAVVPHPLAPVLDHILPLAAGGTHEPANVQCAHFMCNSVKSAGIGPNGDQLRLLG